MKSTNGKRVRWAVLAIFGSMFLLISAAGAAEEKSTERGGLVVDRLGEVGYVRPGLFTEEEAEKVGAVLVGMGKEVTQLVFDLRTKSDDGEVRAAAVWLDLFLPKGDVAFYIRGEEGKTAPVRSISEPSWVGDVVLLVDGETGNVGEVIAWVLAKQRAVLVFGEQTGGRGAFFSDGDDAGAEERVTAEVLMGAEGAPLSGRGLEPGYRVEFDPHAKARAFGQVVDLGIASVVREKVRPRRSEASLIDGTDPELPYLLAQSAGEEGAEMEMEWGLAVEDPVLRAALDTLVAAKAMDLEERIEHVKRREFRLEETRRKLEELRKKEAEDSADETRKENGETEKERKEGEGDV